VGHVNGSERICGCWVARASNNEVRAIPGTTYEQKPGLSDPQSVPIPLIAF